MRKRLVPGSVAAVAGLMLVGCAPAANERTPVTVYAAASLQASFDELIPVFEAEHPDIDIRPLVTDGSNVLATQVEEGARPDVIATADERTMERVAELVDAPVVFATNTLVIAAPVGSSEVADLSDLADPALDVVLCAAEVPCGAASRLLLDNAGVDVAPASEEQNVAAVLTKVETGTADAGLVYRTDVVGRDVEAIEAEGADEVVNRYPIAVLREAPEREAAAEFLFFIAGEKGQQVLSGNGFGAP